MARKTDPEGDGTENVSAEETLRPITGTGLKTILKARAQASADRTEINKNVKAKIEEVLGDKKFLDRTMLPVVEKLHNMDDEDLAYHLDNLLYMLDVSGINDRAKKVGRLPLTDERRGRGADAQNVTPLRQAAGE